MDWQDGFPDFPESYKSIPPPKSWFRQNDNVQAHDGEIKVNTKENERMELIIQ